jgi:hypothetical protein
VRAPTHLDESSDVDDGPDAPTREHQASAMMRRLPAPPRSRWWIPAAVLALIVVASVLAVVIGRRGSAPTPPVDAATAALDDAALDVVALPMPIDAGPPTADAATAVAALDAAPAPALATLDVITRPAGAKVRVRGGAALTTPATLALPAGTVTVGISRDGYAPIERTVELIAGEHRTLELVLDSEAERRRRAAPGERRRLPHGAHQPVLDRHPRQAEARRDAVRRRRGAGRHPRADLHQPRSRHGQAHRAGAAGPDGEAQLPAAVIATRGP